MSQLSTCNAETNINVIRLPTHKPDAAATTLSFINNSMHIHGWWCLCCTELRTIFNCFEWVCVLRTPSRFEVVALTETSLTRLAPRDSQSSYLGIQFQKSENEKLNQTTQNDSLFYFITGVLQFKKQTNSITKDDSNRRRRPCLQNDGVGNAQAPPLVMHRITCYSTTGKRYNSGVRWDRSSFGHCNDKLLPKTPKTPKTRNTANTNNYNNSFLAGKERCVSKSFW